MRRLVALCVIALAAGAVGCGQQDDSTPVACLEGSGPYLRALKEAPGEVTLDGETAIGDCLVENQKGGELATVGTALVAAATKLNAEARAEPGGKANLQLGYLLGAAESGAEETEGIHAELIRRLSTAARYNPDNRPLPPIFLHTYQEGFDAAASN
ncbi:MAG TPA: hypothetical protein VJQ84_11305 [Solirubrobacterales bacterium]|nr:hypothetical protein [Solirubrobacterales bacterium]